VQTDMSAVGGYNKTTVSFKSSDPLVRDQNDICSQPVIYFAAKSVFCQ